MTPREITFNHQTVLDGAFNLVRQEGMEHLSARKVAEHLQSSVAPVYSAFGSMIQLSREVLARARDLMDKQTRQHFTEIPFLNIGVGLVVFARDEANLFRALFHSRHIHQDLLKNFHDSIIRRMKQDPMLSPLPEESLRRLLANIELYTLGLADAIIYGQIQNNSTENIIQLIKNIGNVLIFSEVSGIIECESPESKQEWQRILKEKNIPWLPHKPQQIISEDKFKKKSTPKSKKEEK